LRRVRYEFKHHLTDEEFARAVGASEQAVASWLRLDKDPVTPNTTYMVRIAKCANVQLTWLLQGVGAEELGAPREIGEMAGALHEYVTGVLASGLKAKPEFVGRALPQPLDLLRKVISEYREAVRSKAAEARELRQRVSLLGRFLAEESPRTFVPDAISRGLLDLSVKRLQSLAALGPVDPDAPETPSTVPGVPPLRPFGPRAAAESYVERAGPPEQKDEQ